VSDHRRGPRRTFAPFTAIDRTAATSERMATDRMTGLTSCARDDRSDRTKTAVRKATRTRSYETTVALA